MATPVVSSLAPLPLHSFIEFPLPGAPSVNTLQDAPIELSKLQEAPFQQIVVAEPHKFGASSQESALEQYIKAPASMIVEPFYGQGVLQKLPRQPRIIFIGGLNVGIPDEAIYAAMGAFGNVVSLVRKPHSSYNQANYGYQFGFVEFSNDQQALLAIQVGECYIGDTRLELKPKHQSPVNSYIKMAIAPPVRAFKHQKKIFSHPPKPMPFFLIIEGAPPLQISRQVLRKFFGNRNFIDARSPMAASYSGLCIIIVALRNQQAAQLGLERLARSRIFDCHLRVRFILEKDMRSHWMAACDLKWIENMSVHREFRATPGNNRILRNAVRQIQMTEKPFTPPHPAYGVAQVEQLFEREVEMRNYRQMRYSPPFGQRQMMFGPPGIIHPSMMMPMGPAFHPEPMGLYVHAPEIIQIHEPIQEYGLPEDMANDIEVYRMSPSKDDQFYPGPSETSKQSSPTASHQVTHFEPELPSYMAPDMPQASGPPADSTNLFVKNLCDEVVPDAKALDAIFGKFGPIASVFLPTYPDSKLIRGFGMVKFEKEEHALAALKAMNGKFLGRKQIMVTYHEPADRREKRIKEFFASAYDETKARKLSVTEVDADKAVDSEKDVPVKIEPVVEDDTEKTTEVVEASTQVEDEVAADKVDAVETAEVVEDSSQVVEDEVVADKADAIELTEETVPVVESLEVVVDIPVETVEEVQDLEVPESDRSAHVEFQENMIPDEDASSESPVEHNSTVASELDTIDETKVDAKEVSIDEDTAVTSSSDLSENVETKDFVSKDEVSATPVSKEFEKAVLAPLDNVKHETNSNSGSEKLEFPTTKRFPMTTAQLIKQFKEQRRKEQLEKEQVEDSDHDSGINKAVSKPQAPVTARRQKSMQNTAFSNPYAKLAEFNEADEHLDMLEPELVEEKTIESDTPTSEEPVTPQVDDLQVVPPVEEIAVRIVESSPETAKVEDSEPIQVDEESTLDETVPNGLVQLEEEKLAEAPVLEADNLDVAPVSEEIEIPTVVQETEVPSSEVPKLDEAADISEEKKASNITAADESAESDKSVEKTEAVAPNDSTSGNATQSSDGVKPIFKQKAARMRRAAKKAALRAAEEAAKEVTAPVEKGKKVSAAKRAEPVQLSVKADEVLVTLSEAPMVHLPVGDKRKPSVGKVQTEAVPVKAIEQVIEQVEEQPKPTVKIPLAIVPQAAPVQVSQKAPKTPRAVYFRRNGYSTFKSKEEIHFGDFSEDDEELVSKPLSVKKPNGSARKIVPAVPTVIVGKKSGKLRGFAAFDRENPHQVHRV